MNDKPENTSGSDFSPTFYERLPKLLLSHEIEQQLRITKQGVFVDESLVPRFLEAYRAWLQESSPAGEKRSEDKIRRRLFGPEQPKLYYLLDGKRCLAGFFVQGPVPESRTSRIPLSQANPMDTRETLHHKDSVLSSVPGIKSRVTPHEGFVIEFHAANGKYDVTEAVLKEFASVARNSHVILKEYPQLRGPLRYSLQPFLRLIEQLRPVSTEQRLLVPVRFQKNSGVRALRYRSIIVLAEGEKRLIACYDLKGRGFGRFVREELGKLGGPPDGTGIQSVRGFEPTKGKVQYLGKLWTKGMSFHLHARTFLLFYRDLFRPGKAPKKFSSKVSVRDIIERLVWLFQGSRPIDELTLLPYLGKRRRPFAKYRRNGRWIFVLTDKNVVSSCFEVAELDAAETQPQEQGSGSRRPEGGRRGRGGKGGPGGRHHRGRQRHGKGGGRREGGERGGRPGSESNRELNQKPKGEEK